MNKQSFQKLEPPPPSSEFGALYERVRTTLLHEVPPKEMATCEIAFADRNICWLLYDTIRRTRPRSVVETGSFMGMSTLIAASALAKNAQEGSEQGRIYTISLDSFYRICNPMSHAARCAEKLQLEEFTVFLEGSSIPFMSMESNDPTVAQEREAYLRRLARENRESLLPRLARLLGTIDLAYLDSLHYEGAQIIEIASVLDHLSPNGSIIMDDVFFPDREPAWIVEAFARTSLAGLTLYESNGAPLRIMSLQRNPNYRGRSGFFSTWWWPGTLEGFIDRFRLHPVQEQAR